jgi:hypothetical protein
VTCEDDDDAKKLAEDLAQRFVTHVHQLVPQAREIRKVSGPAWGEENS